MQRAHRIHYTEISGPTLPARKHSRILTIQVERTALMNGFLREERLNSRVTVPGIPFRDRGSDFVCSANTYTHTHIRTRVLTQWIRFKKRIYSETLFYNVIGYYLTDLRAGRTFDVKLHRIDFETQAYGTRNATPLRDKGKAKQTACNFHGILKALR